MNKTLKKTLSIILTVLMIVTTIPFAFAADCVHDYSGEHTCLGYYCGNCGDYYGEPGPHWWISDQCMICLETHEHTGDAGTICMGTLCEICYYPYGEVTDPDAHDWNSSGTCGYCGAECEHPYHTDGVCDDCGKKCLHEGQSGACKICGENLGKLVIDLSEVTSSFAEIGNGYTYYDEDGYIITGTNTNVTIDINDSCDITFNNMSAKSVYIWSSAENVTVTLDGDNYMYGYFNVYKSHLTINGDDDDTLNIVSNTSAFSTSGNPGTLTVNGGKINAVIETTSNYPTIWCGGGFTLNGGEFTASNNNYYVISDKTIINGGTLNVISTSPDMEAINGDVEIAKGALLTVSTTYKAIRSDYNITSVNEAEENLFFFAKFDTASDFAIVSDIKDVIKDKTYAEIKVDTHEHDLDNSGKCICGYECPHESITDGTCGDCGYVCLHENYTGGVCDVCGESCEHSGGTATCTEPAVCKVCHEYYGDLDPENHGDFSEWEPYSDTQHFRYCVDCGQNEQFKSHSGGTATCVGGKICELCKTEYGEVDADAHDWSNKDGVCANACGYECPHESYTDGKCGVCGYECPHENFNDGTCNDCGYECPHESITDGVCENCGYVNVDYTVIDEYIKSLEEKLDNDRIWDGSYKAALDYYKSVVEEMKDNVNTSAADLAAIENELKDLEAELDDFLKEIAEAMAIYDRIIGETGKYTEENVKSSDKEAIVQLTIDMGLITQKCLTENEIATLNEAKRKLDNLYRVIDNVQGAIRACQGWLDSQSEETIKPDNKVDLQTIRDLIQPLIDGDNITDEERATINEMLEKVEALEKRIAEENCANGVHVWGGYYSNHDATCTADGTKTAICLNGCGTEDTVADEGSKIDHADEDGDYICDHGCGHEFPKPVDPTPDVPDTPDEPADDTCDRCGEVHTNFFQNFICMIRDFFNRIINFFVSLFK